ncbi:hypothetical protein AEGHOMDF_4864 [Methylobacterium soli]|nr:hypothetical protein AEGHOMDF_4864 [Methylobacterium soli]
MADQDGAVVAAGDGVVRPHVPEDGRVDIPRAAVPHDLADDGEIARIDLAFQHQRIEGLAPELGHGTGLDHALDQVALQVDLPAHAVGAVGGAVVADADAHVEPAVAVDEVVAAAALDDVAAAAAEEDVAVVEGDDRLEIDAGPGRSGRGPVAEERPEAVDPVDPGLRELVAHHGVLGAGQNRSALGLPGRRDVAAIVALEGVVVRPAGERLDGVEAVAQDVFLVGGEDRAVEVGIGGLGVALVDRPIEAEHALVAHDALALDHDVVAGFGVEILLVLAGEHHVVADDGRVEEQFRVVARDRVEAVAALEPIVALVAEEEVAAFTAEDEVVAGAAEGLLAVRAGDDEVMALVAEDQRQSAAGVDDVVALLTVQHIDLADIRAAVGDDVVAGAAVDLVDAVAGLDAVVAAAPPDRVVAAAGDDRLARVRALDQDVIEPVVADVLGLAVVVRVDALDELGDRFQIVVVMDRIDVAELRLLGLVDVEHVVRHREDVAGQRVAGLAEIGVAQHDLGEGVVLQFVEEVEALDARQVIEAVGVLEVLELQLEDEREGRAQHAAEGHLLLGHAADPEVDLVEAAEIGRVGPGAVQEGLAVGLLETGIAEHQLYRGVALLLHALLARVIRVRRRGVRHAVRDGLVRAVGGDEVHDRGGVLQVQGEVGPARVGVELAVAVGRLLELRPGGVEARDAGVAAAGDVEGGEIEGDAHELVAQDVGDELVDLVADLGGHAAHDGPGRHLVAHGLGAEGERVQEGVEQVDVVRLAVPVGAIHGLAQHRVAEAVHDVGELGEDRRVDVDRGIEHEDVDVRLNLPGEFLEDEVLVLHLGGEARGLEQALAVPVRRVLEGRDGLRRRRDRPDVDAQPLVQEGEVTRRDRQVLDLLDHVVVLGMEDVVDGRETDILVPAPVARDVMRVEELVVVGGLGAARIHRAGRAVGVLVAHRRIAVLLQEAVDDHRHRRMRDVVQERVVGAHRAGRGDRRGGIAFREHVVAAAELAVGAERLHHLGEAVGTAHELAVLVHDEERDVGDVGIGQVDAEHHSGLVLDVGPGRETPITLKQLAGRHRLALHENVLAQEQLMGGMRGVGLVLVDPGRRQVHRIGGRAGEHHEVGVGARRVVERIIRLERDVDRAVIALLHQIEAVIEELAEQREPGVVRRRQAFVGRDVRDHHALAVHDHAVLVQHHVERGLRGGDRRGRGAARGDGRRQGLVRRVLQHAGIRRRERGGGRRGLGGVSDRL